MEDDDAMSGDFVPVVTGINTYKSATITVDISKYQNIKLYSAYSCLQEDASEDMAEFNKKVWVDRGIDLKYALRACLRKFAKLEKPSLKTTDDDRIKKNIRNATIRKSCEITVEVLRNQSQYQNSKFSSGREWSIEYSSEEERKKIEAEKWDEIAEDIESSMRIFFDAMGKVTDAPEKFSELCRQKIEAKKAPSKPEVHETTVNQQDVSAEKKQEKIS